MDIARGRAVRIAIVLRRELKRQPTQAELDDAENSTLPYLNLTRDEVVKAFDKGEQVRSYYRLQRRSLTDGDHCVIAIGNLCDEVCWL